MTDNINSAILAIMHEVSYVQKEKSKDVNYTLKTENAVIQALRPAMLKFGVFMYPVKVHDIQQNTFEAGKFKNVWNRLVCVHTFRFQHAESGTFIDVEVLGDGADTGDKAGNKSMTTAKKYALLETFLLETGDDPDTTPSPTNTKNKAAGLQQEPTTPARVWTLQQKQAIVDAKCAEHINQAKAMLDLSVLKENSGLTIVTSWARHYRAARDEGKEKVEAAQVANEAYIKAKAGK
jgi:hypothetical protein